MDKLLDRAPVIAAAIATIAAAATVFYLLGLGVACRFSILTLCDLSDYARLSVAWLAPVVLVSVLVALVALGGGKHWWLIAVGPPFAIVLLIAVIRPGAIHPTMSSTSALVTLLAMFSVVVAIAYLMARALKAASAHRELIYALAGAALVLAFALWYGIIAGLSIMAVTKPTIVVHLSNALAPVRAIYVVQLHDALVVRILPTGQWLVIPNSRIELVATLP